MSINDGGPAYPGVVGEEGWPGQTYSRDVNGKNVCTHHSPGMTLRDYFAGQLLPVIYPNSKTCEGAASEAYDMADAMLAERTKGGA